MFSIHTNGCEEKKIPRRYNKLSLFGRDSVYDLDVLQGELLSASQMSGKVTHG